MSQSPLPNPQWSLLPKWQCHKVVAAARIGAVRFEPPMDFGQVFVETDGTAMGLAMDEAWMRKHNPQPGGYFVVYQDGYISYSPAEAFEEGYTRLDTVTVEAEAEQGPNPFPPLAPGFGGEP